MPSRMLDFALVDLGPAPIHHGDVLRLATAQDAPKDVVVLVVLDDLDAHLILLPTMTDHAKEEEEVAVSGRLTKMKVAACHSGGLTMAACPPVPAVAVADLWV